MGRPMKYKKLILLALCLTLTGFVSVSAQTDQRYTIAESVARTEGLTTMFDLLSRFEDLQALLNDPAGEFTLLSPVDGAWTYIDAEGVEVDLTSEIADPVFAEALLRYYIVPTRVYQAGYDLPIEYGTMLPGYSVAAVYDEDMRTVFNGSSIEVDSLPIPAENGMIMLLEAGLPIIRFSEMGREYASPAHFTASGVPRPLESNRSVTNALTEASGFAIMLRLLAAFPETAQQLENGGLYTLIAPTDAALIDSGWSALLDEYMADRSLESYAHSFLESRVWAGYFDAAALRRFVGGGFEIRIQTLNTDNAASLNGFDRETGAVDGVPRVDGMPISEQPILADGVIIYVQEQLDLPG
jgi:uncharacterized surface protein with fasciclin (FAS1) repeats